MTIGIVCYPSYGGSGVVATELGLALANKGHTVHFISYDTPFRLNEFHEKIRFHEVDMTNYPLFKYPLYSLALTSKIVEVCEDYDVDILHVHYAIPHAICAYLARQMSKKTINIVTTLHGTDVSLVGLDKSYFRLVEFGINDSDAVTAVSSYLKDKTTEEFNITKDIDVIANFVDLDKFAPSNKTMSCNFFDSTEKMLIHISNFREVKNIEVVIKTFNIVLNKVSNARLLLVGDGPDLSKARLIAKDFGIIDKISFLGKAERVENILPYADIMLLPSKMESFGLVLLEAMSCGVVTVSSNVGGIPELVDEGVSGFMLDFDDFAAMAKRCIALLLDNKKLMAMKIAARKRASFFNQNRVVCEYEALYRRLLYNSCKKDDIYHETKQQ